MVESEEDSSSSHTGFDQKEQRDSGIDMSKVIQAKIDKICGKLFPATT